MRVHKGAKFALDVTTGAGIPRGAIHAARRVCG